MELLYIWIGDNPIDTLQQEFCFTPEYDILSIPLIEDHSLRWRSPPNTLSKSTSSKY